MAEQRTALQLRRHISTLAYSNQNPVTTYVQDPHSYLPIT